ncbi:MAG: hypothetical protein IT176_11440 [Acidobacteria bacterium]|nr:hypothetical protein [Acidobacteriota bacterium]
MRLTSTLYLSIQRLADTERPDRNRGSNHTARPSIEVDKRTADVLQTRAADFGVTVFPLIVEPAILEQTALLGKQTSTSGAELGRRLPRQGRLARAA